MTEPRQLKAQVRPMNSNDLEQVLGWRNNVDIRRYMHTQHEISLDEHLRWFERCRLDKRKHLLIFEADKQALGFVNFSELASGAIAEWGFYVAPDAPKGSGRELGVTALNHAFNNLKLHKICGQTLAFNERSIRLFQSFGFQQEGTFRDQHFDGERYHDVFCFGLLSHEWQPKL